MEAKGRPGALDTCVGNVVPTYVQGPCFHGLRLASTCFRCLRRFFPYPQKPREPWQALGGEAVVAVGDQAADGRWIGTLGILETAAETEAHAILAFDQQRAEHAAVFALAGQVRDHAGFGVVPGFELEQAVAAACAIAVVLMLQHQPFAAAGDDGLQEAVQGGGVDDAFLRYHRQRR